MYDIIFRKTLFRFDDYYEFPAFSGRLIYNEQGEIEVISMNNDTLKELYTEPAAGVSIDVMSSEEVKFLFEVPAEVVDNNEKSLFSVC